MAIRLRLGKARITGLFTLTSIILAGLAPATGSSAMSPASVPAAHPAASPRPQIRLASIAAGRTLTSGRIPLTFEPNLGQFDASVAYVARGAAYTLFLTTRGAVLSLAGRPAQPASPRGASPSGRRPSSPTQTLVSRAGPATGAVVLLSPLGSDPRARLVPSGRLAGDANYFIGRDPRRWRTHVPTYAAVTFRGVYPGIDLKFYGAPGRLEYDWITAPGADPRQIRLSVQGRQQVQGRPVSIVAHVDRQNNLTLPLALGALVQRVPAVYQVIGGRRHDVAVRYTLRGAAQVGFALGAYDRRQSLTIDPVLSYATYLGGAGDEDGESIAVDGAGNAYVTGPTSSTNFPTTTGAYSTTAAGNFDVFVSKLNAAGNALVYSTYLGGTGTDTGQGIAVDGAGNAYVTGSTSSTNFPTKNALQSVYGGGANDAFVTKLNASGSALVYSTYLGGSGDDEAAAIAVDSAGVAYITGFTDSSNYPLFHALQSVNGGGGDAFVSVLNAAGSALAYSTYLGGSGADIGNAIAADNSGNAYVTGSTGSTNFPTSTGAFSTTNAGGSDAFVTKLKTTASGAASLVYSTYLGGSKDDAGNGIALDAAGDAYVVGTTASTNFPTKNALQGSNGGGTSDAFVTKLNPSGSGLIYSTYLGGSKLEFGYAIAVDSGGQASVTGDTGSPNFPTVSPLQAHLAGSGCTVVTCEDAFISTLNAGGGALVFSTYLGGARQDFGAGIAVDRAGALYVTGSTESSDFPTASALQTGLAGGKCFACNAAFVVKIRRL